MIAADWSRALETVRELESVGCKWLHFDVMDGHFVPNLTLGPMFLSALRAHTELHFDAHLMISNPSDFIDEFLQAGANSISVHVENQTHLHRLIARIKDGGALAGAVINPATPVEALDVVLDELDYVLVMSVNPGFSGQKFLPLSLPKIAALKQRRNERGLKFQIQIDGGMSIHSAPDAVAAGADILVSASGLFVPGQSLPQSARALWDAVESGLARRRDGSAVL